MVPTSLTVAEIELESESETFETKLAWNEVFTIKQFNHNCLKIE
jgi:hypothetical protein